MIKLCMEIFTKLRSAGVLALTTMLVINVIYASQPYGQSFSTTNQMKNVLARLETNTDRFNRSIDRALDRSRFNNTDVEDQTNALVDEFEFATDRLKDRVDDNVANNFDVNEVLRRGMYLDMFIRRHNFSSSAEADWHRIRNDLDRLARVYDVTWTWSPGTMYNSSHNKAWTRHAIQRLEQTTDQFRSSFDAGLDRSRIDGSSYEDFMNNKVKQFERSVDKLKEDANNSRLVNSTDIMTALNNAVIIDEFLKRHGLPARTRRDWARVKANLDDLAFLNRVAWDWSVRPNVPIVATDVLRVQGQRIGLSALTSNRSLNAVAREVRHELLSDLPYYGVFDWIEFEVMPDNTVVLRGEVTTPPDTKSRAEAVVADVPGVSRVINEIRVLPVSPNDDRLRRALYNAIYDFNSPLFRYVIGSRQAIHIIVDGGRATLKGVVDTEGDKQQAYVRASGVPGLFSVSNELMVAGEGVAR